VCQGILGTRCWVCLESVSAGIRGISGVEIQRGGEAEFSTIWRGPAGVFDAQPGTKRERSL